MKGSFFYTGLGFVNWVVFV